MVKFHAEIELLWKFRRQNVPFGQYQVGIGVAES